VETHNSGNIDRWGHPSVSKLVLGVRFHARARSGSADFDRIYRIDGINQGNAMGFSGSHVVFQVVSQFDIKGWLGVERSEPPTTQPEARRNYVARTWARDSRTD